ncbi:hypothetical protein D3C72_1907130 [compost metagenome]
MSLPISMVVNCLGKDLKINTTLKEIYYEMQASIIIIPIVIPIFLVSSQLVLMVVMLG